MNKIILASGSPRRRKLLKQLNIPFDHEKNSVPESHSSRDAPRDIVQMLALRKARAAAESRPRQKCLIIGADTIVILNGEILEKPDDKKDAASMLASLSGKTHEVLTGVALLKILNKNNNSKEYTFFEKTEVTMASLQEEEIARYVKSGKPLDKAGAYGIQDNWGALFVEGIKGDYNNVVGFPLHAFYKNVKSFAPEYINTELF